MSLAVAPEFGTRIRRDEPLSRPHLLARRRPGGSVLQSARQRATWRLPASCARGGADHLDRPRQQSAGARRGPQGHRHLHARHARCAGAAQRDDGARRGRRRLRAHRQGCINWGLGQAEFLAGIPGTLGGALAMNAGAFGGETWQHVASVETIDRAGRTHRRPPTEYRVSYRQVVAPVPEEWFIAANLSFERRPGAHEAEVRELLERRKASQPIGEWSCGSVFTNPPGDHAARLIETAGLKGYRIGDASVSQKHANFIINHGKASAARPRAPDRARARRSAARARRRPQHGSAHRGSAVSDAPVLRATRAATHHCTGAISAASRCCSAATRASGRSRCCPATRCWRPSSAAASMPTPSIRATRPRAAAARRASRASGSRCTARAARTARCRARSSIWACPTPAAVSWARRSAWTSCAPSAWRSRSACRPRTSWCCAGRRTSSSRSSAWSCR